MIRFFLSSGDLNKRGHPGSIRPLEQSLTVVFRRDKVRLYIKYDCMTMECIMPTQIVRVQEKGQVTIPLEIREKLKLKKGDLVTFVETDEGVLIKPAEVIVTEALNEIGKVLQEKGINLEELMMRGREIRGELIEKEYGIRKSQSE